MTPHEIVETWSARLRGNEALAQQIGGTFRLSVRGVGGGSWLFTCVPRMAIERSDATAECTIEVEAEALVNIVTGGLNPQAAYLNGALTVSGDPLLALRVSRLFSESL